MAIDLLNESGAEVDEAQLLRLVAFDLERLFVHPDAEVSVVLVDVPTIEHAGGSARCMLAGIHAPRRPA